MQKLKGIGGNILGFLFAIYIIVSLIITPYNNWEYAKNNGFVKWFLFGEVVATVKAFGWPYYIIFDNKMIFTWTLEDKNSNRHYRNSKKACDEAIELIIKERDILRIDTQQTKQVIELLKLSLSEANLVSDSFLKKVNLDFYQKYNQDYKKGLQMILDGMEAKATAHMLNGVYSYNEFVEWVKNNREKFKFPKMKDT